MTDKRLAARPHTPGRRTAAHTVSRGALLHHLDRIDAAADALALILEAAPDPRDAAARFALSGVLTSARAARALITHQRPPDRSSGRF